MIISIMYTISLSGGAIHHRHRRFPSRGTKPQTATKREIGQDRTADHASAARLNAVMRSSANAASHRQRSIMPGTATKSYLVLASINRSRLLTIVAVVRYFSKLIRGSLSLPPPPSPPLPPLLVVPVLVLLVLAAIWDGF